MIKRTDIINTLFENYGFQSYLEIGVANPDANFNHIKATIKESIDPRTDCGNVYSYNVTSDDFFANYVGDKKYDVIFIDGIHVDEQVYRDIRNSLNHLNYEGFIVVHDCNPITEPHPITNNGTVFKAFIRLKKELKDWCCFVIDEDDGCGIITQRGLLENKILDVIELTWDEFDKNRQALLQLVPFEEYIQSIRWKQ